MEPLARPLASTVAAAPQPVVVALWHGTDGSHGAVLGLAALGFLVGTGLFIGVMRRRRAVAALARALARGSAEAGFDRGLAAIQAAAIATTRVLQSGRLPRYVLITVVFALGVTAAALPLDLRVASTPWPARWYEDALLALAGAGALGAAITRDRLIAVAAVGVTGLMLALLFALLSAPDLGLTQVAVESLQVIVLVLVLRRLPARAPSPAWTGQLGRIAVAGGGGLILAALLVAATTPARFASDAAIGQIARAPGEHADNVVNAILVDFRAIDTLGEVTVLAIAGLGVFALVRSGRGHPERGA
jgi:multicomponent Na+:H+ antiporter subunit A